jgi:hypothetical protein
MAAKDWADLFGEELHGAVIEFTRLQTLLIMNEAGERGPAWSGEFRDSWRAQPGDGVKMANPGRAASAYPYELRDIPRPAYDAKTYAKRKKLFAINNIAPHKYYALDAKEGTFYPPGDRPEPIKDRVMFGKRARKGLRAAITPNDELEQGERPGTASATAEDGWFTDLNNDLGELMRANKVELMRKARRTMREKMRRRRAK